MAGIKYGVAVAGGVQINSGVTLSGAFVPTTNIDMLVVAAGGGAGIDNNGAAAAGGGGGGAGGLIYTSSPNFAVGTTYTVSVSGSAAGQTNGGNTSVSGGSLNFVAIGGGRGGSNSGSSVVATGQPGGSGGGSSFYGSYPAGGAGQQPSSASGGFGNNGAGTSSGLSRSAGGGGAGGVGINSNDTAVINGGIGKQYDISGTLTYYSGGGSGEHGLSNADFGGGPTNYGGGGESRLEDYTSGPGVVYIRYPSQYSEATVTGAVTVSVVGSNRIYRFTGAGTFKLDY